MEQKKILRYAIRGAMIKWEKEWSYYEENPTNEVAFKRFKKIDKEVDELKWMLMHGE